MKRRIRALLCWWDIHEWDETWRRPDNEWDWTQKRCVHCTKIVKTNPYMYH